MEAHGHQGIYGVVLHTGCRTTSARSSGSRAMQRMRSRTTRSISAAGRDLAGHDFRPLLIAVSRWHVGQSPDEPVGWAKMLGCRPVFYYANGSIYAADAQEPTVTIWHMSGYPPGTRTAVRTLHQSQGV
jgi:hypothetical protein